MVGERGERIELWLFLALAAVTMYGSSQVAQKVALNSMSAASMVTFSILIALPTYIVCLLPFIITGMIWTIAPISIIFALLGATFGQAGYYTYVEAAHKGPISIVGSVTATYPIMAIGFGLFFLGESPTIVQLAGAFIITASIVALSYSHDRRNEKIELSRRFYLICLITVLLWGFWAIFTKLALNDISALLFLGVYTIIIPPTTIIYYRLKKISFRKSIPKWSVPVMIAIMSSMVGNIAFFTEIHAADLGPASIVFPLIASAPLVVVLLAYAFLKERLSRKEWLLVACVIMGIIMVSSS